MKANKVDDNTITENLRAFKDFTLQYQETEVQSSSDDEPSSSSEVSNALSEFD